MLFNPRIVDETFVHAQYLENIGHKKGKPSGSKQKEHQEASKERKKKWKGENDKNMKTISHQCKDPNNHCNNDGHIREKCQKLHLELNLKNHKKESKKKNLIATYLSDQVEKKSDVDENIVCTSVQKDVSMSFLHQQEEKEMTKFFHIKIQVKKSKIDSSFDSGSQAILIATNVVNKLELEVHDHVIPYPLGWVNKDANIKVMKQCKIKFVCKC
jgi:hypothetical protein